VKAPSVDLLALVRAEVRATFAVLLTALDPPPYSTRKGCGPEGWAERRWKATAPTIPGAYRPAGARWWSIPRAAFEAWAAAQAPTPAPAAPSKPWHPRDEMPGLRLVARSK